MTRSRRTDQRDDATPDRLTRLPSWLLSQAAVRSHRLLTHALVEVDARGFEYRLLAALAEAGPSSQASLGRSVGLDRRDVAVTIGELEQKGVVNRSADPTDIRRNVVTLTPAGRRRLRRLDAVVEEVQAELLAALSPTERRQLTALLARLQP